MTQENDKMDLRQIVVANSSTLLRCLDPSDELLLSLRSTEFVKDRLTFVEQHATLHSQSKALLTTLLEAPGNLQQLVMNEFIAALRSCGQDHVANILRPESDKLPMSDEHREMLTNQTAELRKFMDPENGVLSKLFSLGVITSADKSRIRSKIGLDDMVEELIDTILRKSDDAFRALIDSLNETGQSHVVFILTGQGDSHPLGEDNRKKLREKRAEVVSSVYSKCLESTLISKGVLTSHDQQRVEGRKTNNEKCEVILDLISRKSQAAFDSFIETLQQCDHEHVAEELMGAEVSATLVPRVNARKMVVNPNNNYLEVQIRQNMQRSFYGDETEVKQLKETLESNGISVSQIAEGSIIVKFRCISHAALLSLRELYNSKKLDQLFSEAFCPKFADKGLQSLDFVISEEEFQRHEQQKLMTPEHRETLLSSREWLVDSMTVSDVLLGKLSLCPRRKQEIERAETDEQQVNTLLDIVSRQPDSAFAQLLYALDSDQQTDVVSHLRKFERSQSIQSVSSCT